MKENSLNLEQVLDLILKVCSFSNNKDNAIKIMIRALEEFRIEGVRTNIELLLRVLKTDDFNNGNYHCNYLDNNLKDFDKERC